MTTDQISKAGEIDRTRSEIKHGAAIEIRQILDDSRKAYGADDWDDGDVETAVLELVTEAL